MVSQQKKKISNVNSYTYTTEHPSHKNTVNSLQTDPLSIKSGQRELTTWIITKVKITFTEACQQALQSCRMPSGPRENVPASGSYTRLLSCAAVAWLLTIFPNGQLPCRLHLQKNKDARLLVFIVLNKHQNSFRARRKLWRINHVIVLRGAIILPPGELGRREVIWTSGRLHFPRCLEDWGKVRLLE